MPDTPRHLHRTSAPRTNHHTRYPPQKKGNSTADRPKENHHGPHQPGTAPHRTGQFLRRAPERTSFHPQREGTHRHRHWRRPLRPDLRTPPRRSRYARHPARTAPPPRRCRWCPRSWWPSTGLRRRILRNPQPHCQRPRQGTRPGRPDRHPQLLRLLAVPAAGRPSNPQHRHHGHPRQRER